MPVEIEGRLRDIIDAIDVLCDGGSPLSESERGECRSQIRTMRNALNSPCKVVVTGAVKKGKSTFVNSLLKDDIVKVGVTETTATVCEISSATPINPTLPVLCSFRDSNQPPVYISREEANQMQGHSNQQLELSKQVRCLHYALGKDAPEMLRHFVLADTPGLGSSEQVHTYATTEYLPEASALILMVNNAWVREEEKEWLLSFLKKTLDFGYEGNPIFLLYSRLDNTTATLESYIDFIEEKAKQISIINKELKSVPGAGAINDVMAVSAYLEIMLRKYQDSFLHDVFDNIARNGYREIKEILGNKEIWSGLNIDYDRVGLNIQRLIAAVFQAQIGFETVKQCCNEETLRDIESALAAYENDTLEIQKIASKMSCRDNTLLQKIRSAEKNKVNSEIIKLEESLYSDTPGSVNHLIEKVKSARAGLDAVVDCISEKTGFDEKRIISMLHSTPSYAVNSGVGAYERAISILRNISGMDNVRSSIHEWITLGNRVFKAKRIAGQLNNFLGEKMVDYCRMIRDRQNQEILNYNEFCRVVRTTPAFCTGQLGEAIRQLIKKFSPDGNLDFEERLKKIKTDFDKVKRDLQLFNKYEYVQNFYARHKDKYAQNEQNLVEDFVRGVHARTSSTRESRYALSGIICAIDKKINSINGSRRAPERIFWQYLKALYEELYQTNII